MTKLSRKSQCLFGVSLLLLLTGCPFESSDGYKSERRQARLFQNAEQPVHRFRIEDSAFKLKEPTIQTPIDEFELPDQPTPAVVPPTRTSSPAPILSIESMPSQPSPPPLPVPVAKPTPPPWKLPDFYVAPQKTELPKVDAKANMSIKDLQYLLQKLGYYQGKVDGVSGPKTKAAIRAFQKAKGLKVDGIVGPKTRQALLEHFKNSVR